MIVIEILKVNPKTNNLSASKKKGIYILDISFFSEI